MTERERIANLIEAAGKPVTVRELAHKLRMTTFDCDCMVDRLVAYGWLEPVLPDYREGMSMEQAIGKMRYTISARWQLCRQRAAAGETIPAIGQSANGQLIATLRRLEQTYGGSVEESDGITTFSDNRDDRNAPDPADRTEPTGEKDATDDESAESVNAALRAHPRVVYFEVKLDDTLPPQVIPPPRSSRAARNN